MSGLSIMSDETTYSAKASDLAALAEVALGELGEDPAMSKVVQEERRSLEDFHRRAKPSRMKDDNYAHAKREVLQEKKPRKVGSRAKLSKESSGEIMMVFACFYLGWVAICSFPFFFPPFLSFRLVLDPRHFQRFFRPCRTDAGGDECVLCAESRPGIRSFVVLHFPLFPFDRFLWPRLRVKLILWTSIPPGSARMPFFSSSFAVLHFRFC